MKLETELNTDTPLVAKFMEELDNITDDGRSSMREFKTGDVEENPFEKISKNVAKLLLYKNNKYGKSALNPINVFNGKTKVGQRADDKVSRIQNNTTLQKNDVVDLIGYLILMCQENNWETFDEFMD